MCVQSLQIIIFGGFLYAKKLLYTWKYCYKDNGTEDSTMCEMFARFMWFKRSEGLATRIIEEYGIHFIWLLDYSAC